jgi:hypothetical protein
METTKQPKHRNVRFAGLPQGFSEGRKEREIPKI